MQFSFRNRLRMLAACVLISSFGVVAQATVPSARPPVCAPTSQALPEIFSESGEFE